MRLLLVAATILEIEPLLKRLEMDASFTKQEIRKGWFLYRHEKQVLTIDILVTGVGMVATAFHLGSARLFGKYDLAINLGIAGSFERKWPLGTVVNIAIDCFPELGAEDGSSFLSIHDLNLLDKDELPFQQGWLLAADAAAFPEINQLQRARGITVNKVHGDDPTIAAISKRLQPQIESMEGAAFFYACSLQDLPAYQIRAVSNYVERRNRNAWNIGLALKQLNDWAYWFIANRIS